ncbi:MAG: TRM11 family SAM-dependent methyltransferase [Cellulosilyticaceae bacterium]
MIEKLYEQIRVGNEVRKNLIELRKELKEPRNARAFYYLLDEDYSVLYQLLGHEDAKVRKNVALIMGVLGEDVFAEHLYEAYEKEEKLFVKADYLAAMSELEYEPYMEVLQERLHFLTSNSFDEGSQKHIQEEIRQLTSMLLSQEQPKMHTFNGYDVLSDVILLTNREHQDVTKEQITDGLSKTFNAGVLVRTQNMRELMQIRTYTDILFKLGNIGALPNDPVAAAEAIYKGGLVAFLNERHTDYPPYYFRIELKSKMPLDKKSAFTKKMAAILEQLSKRELINTTSHYEFEIRLIENKEGMFNVVLKLNTLKDQRFAYRKQSVAASIVPAQAALIAKLAEPYLKEDAQVLDPFCGVATMLVERNALVPAHPMYGLDTFGEAIDKAIENTNRADVPVHLINRDFFDFKHDYRFDEIFTNMPTRGGRKNEADMAMLYERFFRKSLEVLKERAIIVMYTRDPKLMLGALQGKKQYTIVEEFAITPKEEGILYIIEVNQRIVE